MEEINEGLTENEIKRRLDSGNYIYNSKNQLVSVGTSSVYDIVKEFGFDYVLDLWFSCWRAQRYGIPGSRFGDHAFYNSGQHYDEDDPIFIKKIQNNKMFYNEWIKSCRRKNINPSDFEWLFVGNPRTLCEIKSRIGLHNLKNTIKNSLLAFQEVCECK